MSETGYSPLTPQPQPVGRPTKYVPEMCDKVIEWGRLGKSRAWMASHLEIGVTTLGVWENKYDEFRAALERSRMHAQAFWEDLGQNNILNRELNSAVWIRSMAARFPDDWRESTKQEISGADGAPLVPVINVSVGNDQS